MIMYKTFLKIVVVIIGVFYIASFCEFDQNECRQNYDNETHAYIHVDNVNAKLIKLPVDAKQLCIIPFRINIPSQTLYQTSTQISTHLYCKVITKSIFSIRYSSFDTILSRE